MLHHDRDYNTILKRPTRQATEARQNKKKVMCVLKLDLMVNKIKEYSLYFGQHKSCSPWHKTTFFSQSDTF